MFHNLKHKEVSVDVVGILLLHFDYLVLDMPIMQKNIFKVIEVDVAYCAIGEALYGEVRLRFKSSSCQVYNGTSLVLVDQVLFTLDDLLEHR